MEAEISSHAVSDPRQRIAAVLGVALEVLWLIAVVAVPLAAAPPGAMIGHFEVPKVAVLRVVSFAIVVVWLVEWMVRPPHLWPRLPRVSATGLSSWLKRDPSNWITLTLGIYLVANIVSTATSVSSAVSVWGKRPGWDGYDLYAMLCYTVLFLVIVTHLRRPSQAWRLIGALVVTGTFVGIYIILQYLGLDPYLAKGRALTRPYGTLGNPVFAGAVLVMTTTVTVAAGFALIERFRSYWWPVSLVAALTPQLLAIILTLTRGAWVGLLVGLVVFLVLHLLLHARRRSLLMFVAVLASFGLSIIALVSLDGKGGGKEGDGPLDSVVVGRVLSIYPEITGSGISQRTDTWIGSTELMLERPWHDVTPIGLQWARHPLGYGPEMFRFTFPLRSEPRAIAQFPYEAHNFALHVGVELGIVGLLSLLAAVFAVLWIGSRRLVVAAHSMPHVHWTILAGLLATFVGRGVEMMAGIPKAGDLTPLVALLGLYVFLLKTNDREEADDGVGGQQPYASPQRSRSAWGPLMARAVLVFVLVVTLGVVTWMKGVNYARADAIAANANRLFAGGDSQAGVMTALRATSLAPDVQSYYRQASRMFDALASDVVSADSKQRWALGAYTYGRRAADANGLDPAARAALAGKAISLGLLGEAGRFEEAVELYDGVVAMSPRFATVRYAAASAMLLAGDPQAALDELDAGDTLLNQAERRPSVAAQGAYLRGIARRQQGDLGEAVQYLERSLTIEQGGRYAAGAHRILAELYEDMDDSVKAAEHREALE